MLCPALPCPALPSLPCKDGIRWLFYIPENYREKNPLAAFHIRSLRKLLSFSSKIFKLFYKTICFHFTLWWFNCQIASAWNYTSRNKPVGKMPFAIRWSEKCRIVTSDMNVWKIYSSLWCVQCTYVLWYMAVVSNVISFDNDSIILHLFDTRFHHFERQVYVY